MNEPPPLNPQFPPQMPPPGYGPPGYQAPRKNNNVIWIVLACVFGAMVLGCLVLAAILFPVFAQARAAARRTTRLSDLKQVGLGCLMYANDHKDHLPDMTNFGSFETEVEPYLKNSTLFFDPITKGPIVLNTKLSKADLETLDKPFQKVLAYNPTLESGNRREVVFADGHAKIIPDEELQSDLGGSSGF
jgi:hypothetical protein